MNAAINTQSAKALKSAYFCYFLAGLVMLVTAWVIVQGIQATEPASPARNAKVASGVLLLVLEGCVFSLAGQWREFSFVLRTLGWSIFTLQIALMTLANYSVGATAGKAAALSTATVAQIVAQADDSRKNAATLRDAAAKLNKSKHGWLNEQGGKVSAEAAQQTAAGAGAVEKLEKMQALTTSTPLVETIGETGLMVLSGAISLVMECAGIALMHVAGSLRRKASSGALPVDQQILELLHRIHGGPVAPAETVAPVTALAAPVAPAQTAPAPANYRPAGTASPAQKDATAGLSYSSKTMLAGAGALAALTAPMAHAAPAANADTGVSKPIHAGVSETIHAQSVNTGSADASNTTPALQEIALADVSKPIHADVSKPIQQIVKKPRAKRAVSAKLDTGIEGKAGARFKRIRAGVLAGKIRPSVRGIQAVEGGSQEVVADYLQQLEADGVIVRKGRGYAVTVTKGGAA